jgi:SAM-dependent methyltransferase
VIATDRSEAQLAEAPAHPRVEYRVAPAEASALDTGSADLVTVAQALHWFDRARFYPEARRVIRPGGLLAVWSYGPARVRTPAVDEVVGRFAELVRPWWPPERALVESGYRTIEFPFAELEAPAFEMSADWSTDELLGYLATWSATRACIEGMGNDPLPALRAALTRAGGPASQRHRVEWPLALRVGRAETEKAGPPEGGPAVSLPRSD